MPPAVSQNRAGRLLRALRISAAISEHLPPSAPAARPPLCCRPPRPPGGARQATQHAVRAGRRRIVACEPVLGYRTAGNDAVWQSLTSEGFIVRFASRDQLARFGHRRAVAYVAFQILEREIE